MQAISGVILTGINSLLWPSGLAERIRDSRSELLLFMGLVLLIITSIKNFKNPIQKKRMGRDLVYAANFNILSIAEPVA
jgi:hypothetical protein